MNRRLFVLFLFVILIIIFLSSCSIISKSDPHQEELNTRTAIQLVKEKTIESLTNAVNLCIQVAWSPYNNVPTQQAQCAYDTIFTAEKVSDKEYLVTMTFSELGPTLEYMWANGGVFNSYITPLKYRVLLDNNVVLAEDSIAESFLR